MTNISCYWLDSNLGPLVLEAIALPTAPQRISKHSKGFLNSKTIDSAMGTGCGAVGRAVASNTRDPQFKFSHL